MNLSREFIQSIHMSSLELVFAVEPIRWRNLLSVFPATRSENRKCIAILLLSGDIALNPAPFHDSTFVPTSSVSPVRTDREIERESGERESER